MDSIEQVRTVMFVGEYFALTTTVVLDSELRRDGEDDDSFAARLAATFMSEHYGFHDLEGKSQRVGIVDEDLE